jgi:iron complex outermembrane receptor protein
MKVPQHWLAIQWRRSLAASVAASLVGFASLAAQPPQGDGPPKVDETRVEGVRRPTPPAEPPPAPPPLTPPAPLPEPPAPPLPPAGSEFTSAPADGYRATSATTGTRIDLPLLQTPASVNVVTRELLRDQQIIRVDEFLRDVPSAVKTSDFRRPDSFIIRGFEVQARDFRKNNFLDPTPAPRDMANVERIEILSGPASVLYGSGQPSGVVNFITKKPTDEAFSVGTFQFGNYDLYRVTTDINGPLLGNQNLLFRLNMAYESNDGFRDFGFSERFFISPVLTWRIDDDTNITFEGEFLNARQRFDTGLVALGNRVGNLPIERFLGEPDDRQRFLEGRMSVFFNRRINPDWSYRIGLYTALHDTEMSGTVPVAFGTPFGFPEELLFRQRQTLSPFREQYYSAMADLTGRFCTGGIEHKLLLGTELGFFNSLDFQGRFSEFAAPVPLPFPPFFFLIPTSPQNALAPVYGLPQPPNTPGLFEADFSQYRYGMYAQDVISVTDQLKLLAGLRYEIVDFRFDRRFDPVLFGPGFGPTETDTNYYRLTPRIGAVYEVVPEGLSVYGSYSQSFDPPPGGPVRTAAPLNPETGEMAEGGVKANLFDHRLSVSLAAFRITKQNVTIQDALLFVTQVGEQRSQGFEASAVGQLTDRWSVISNYAYVDSKITDHPDFTIIGNRARNVPRNTANLWTRYDLIQTACHTLGVGTGLVFVDNRSGDLADTFSLPGYTRIDAGVFYQRARVNAAVYLENLFDRQYYTGSVDALSVSPGAPFTVRAMVGITF